MSNSKKNSWEVSDNQENPASMAMLYATGLTDEQMKQPLWGG